MAKMTIKIRDTGWDKIAAQAKRAARNKRVHVGVLGDADGPGDGTLGLPGIAAVHEFGSSDGVIPERSFLRASFDENEEKLEDMMAKLAGQVLVGRRTVEEALEILGLAFSSMVRKFITAGDPIPPPNVPAVAARKQAMGAGDIRTLVDTGAMVQAISHAVVDGADDE